MRRTSRVERSEIRPRNCAAAAATTRVGEALGRDVGQGAGWPAPQWVICRWHHNCNVSNAGCWDHGIRHGAMGPSPLRKWSGEVFYSAISQPLAGTCDKAISDHAYCDRPGCQTVELSLGAHWSLRPASNPRLVSMIPTIARVNSTMLFAVTAALSGLCPINSAAPQHDRRMRS